MYADRLIVRSISFCLRFRVCVCNFNINTRKHIFSNRWLSREILSSFCEFCRDFRECSFNEEKNLGNNLTVKQEKTSSVWFDAGVQPLGEEIIRKDFIIYDIIIIATIQTLFVIIHENYLEEEEPTTIKNHRYFKLLQFLQRRIHRVSF